MLHAFNRKKSTLYRRYLGERDGTEKRVTEEDEITSLIMGPLAMLPDEAIAAFWAALIDLRNPEHALPQGKPTHVSMDFWPSRIKPSDERSKIEPDLMVTLNWADEVRYLLVEFKWRAPLSGENQLHDQWKFFLTEKERAKALHIFIGLETSSASTALSRDNVWTGKLITRTWFDIRSVFLELEARQAALLGRWLSQVERTLDLLAIKPFSGFNNLKHNALPAPDNVFFFHKDLQ